MRGGTTRAPAQALHRLLAPLKSSPGEAAYLFTVSPGTAIGARTLVRWKIRWRKGIAISQRGSAGPAFLRDKSRAPCQFLARTVNTYEAGREQQSCSERFSKMKPLLKRLSGRYSGPRGSLFLRWQIWFVAGVRERERLGRLAAGRPCAGCAAVVGLSVVVGKFSWVHQSTETTVRLLWRTRPTRMLHKMLVKFFRSKFQS